MHIRLFMCEQEPKNSKPLTDYTCLCSANMVSGKKKLLLSRSMNTCTHVKATVRFVGGIKSHKSFFFFKLQKTFITFLNPHIVSPLCNNTSLC